MILNKYYSIYLFYPISVAADPMNPSLNILHLSQGGLTLDTPSDYQDQQLVSQYLKYIQNVFLLILGEDNNSTAYEYATQVLNIEQSLAAISLDPDQMRDPYATYHKMSIKEFFSNITPSMDEEVWEMYFSSAGLAVGTWVDSMYK